MKRGANTFPFHNLLPYSESNEGLFLFFSPSLNWIKEKSVATLAIRNIFCDQKQNKFSKSVHRITPARRGLEQTKQDRKGAHVGVQAQATPARRELNPK